MWMDVDRTGRGGSSQFSPLRLQVFCLGSRHMGLEADRVTKMNKLLLSFVA